MSGFNALREASLEQRRSRGAPTPEDPPTPEATEEEGVQFEAVPDPEPEPEAPTPEPAPDDSQDTPEDPSPSDNELVDEEPKEGHRVPYKTYKRTRDQFRDLKKGVAARDSRIEEMERDLRVSREVSSRMEALLKGRGEQPATPEETEIDADEVWLNEILGDAPDDETPQPSRAELAMAKQLRGLSQQVERLTGMRREDTVSSQISRAVEEFPDVTADQLQSVARMYPNQDLMEVGRAIQAREDERNEAATAKHSTRVAELEAEIARLKSSAVDSEPDPSVPPRPRTSANAPSTAAKPDRIDGESGFDRVRRALGMIR